MCSTLFEDSSNIAHRQGKYHTYAHMIYICKGNKTIIWKNDAYLYKPLVILFFDITVAAFIESVAPQM